MLIFKLFHPPIVVGTGCRHAYLSGGPSLRYKPSEIKSSLSAMGEERLQEYHYKKPSPDPGGK